MLNCMVCGKKPEKVYEDHEDLPYGATLFTSHGHYGSTFFDPMDGSTIEIAICDSCLSENKGNINYYDKNNKLIERP